MKAQDGSTAVLPLGEYRSIGTSPTDTHIFHRMIVDMGCHFNMTRTSKVGSANRPLLTDIDREIQKRLFWGAFLTDATQSLYFGRQPAIQLSQARVPLLLLDTYEEMDDWSPYIDPTIPLNESSLATYSPQPAHAVSTLTAMVKLFATSSRILHSFYSIKCLKHSSQHIREAKAGIEADLADWYNTLPSHLIPTVHTTVAPPPHTLMPL